MIVEGFQGAECGLWLTLNGLKSTNYESEAVFIGLFEIMMSIRLIIIVMNSYLPYTSQDRKII